MGESLNRGWRRARACGRVNLARPAGKFLATGQWRGDTVWILGGGPSLPFLDEPLPGRVIAVNMAFRYPHDLCFVGGRNLLDRLHLEGKKTSTFVSLENAAWNIPPYRQPITLTVTDESWGTTIEGGMPLARSSGCSAINLADILGARVICLLGFDMTVKGERTVNWHTEYPDRMRPSDSFYDIYRAEIEDRACHVRAKVFNCTEGSALRCFEMKGFGECLKNPLTF